MAVQNIEQQILDRLNQIATNTRTTSQAVSGGSFRANNSSAGGDGTNFTPSDKESNSVGNPDLGLNGVGDALDKIGQGVGRAYDNIKSIEEHLANGNIKGALQDLADIYGQLRLGDALVEWVNLNDQIAKFSRQVGQADSYVQALTQTLVSKADVLAHRYNLNPEELVKSFEAVAEATGRIQVPLQNDVEFQAYLKNMGAEGLVGAFDDIGGSISVATSRFTQLQQNAGALGLNLKKAREEMEKNLGLVNKITFREGVNGLQKMVLLTQQMKLNMADLETMTKHFRDVEDSVQNSAKLNMLGGTFASQFSNPLDMMYMANYNVEGLMEKVADSVKTLGKFNYQTGVVDISSLDKRRMEIMAEAVGVSFDSVLKSANRQALTRAMESQFRDQRFTQEQRDMITDRASYNAETGQFEVQLQNGQQVNVRDLTAEMAGLVVSNREEDAQLDIRDNVRDIARLLTKRLQTRSLMTSSYAELAEGQNKGFTNNELRKLTYIDRVANVGNMIRTDVVNNQAEWLAMIKKLSDAGYGPTGLTEKGGALAGQAYQKIKGFGTSTVNGIVEGVATGGGAVLGGPVGAGVGAMVGNLLNGIINPIVDAETFDYGVISQLGGQYFVNDMLNNMVMTGGGVNQRELDDNIPTENVSGYYDYSQMGYQNPNGYATPQTYQIVQQNPNRTEHTRPYMSNTYQTPNLDFSYRGVSYTPPTPSYTPRSGNATPTASVQTSTATSRNATASTDFSKIDAWLSKANQFGKSNVQAQSVASTTVGNTNDWQYWLKQNDNDEDDAREAQNEDVLSYASEVEGAVSVNDPMLQQKAYLSVIKIHELLVDEYQDDLMKVKPSSISNVMPSQGSVSGLKVTPVAGVGTVVGETGNVSGVGSAIGNNTTEVKTTQSPTEVKLVVSGDLKVNTQSLTRQQIEDLVNNRQFREMLVNKLKEDRGGR